MTLKVIDGGATPPADPRREQFERLLRQATEECLKSNPTVAMLVWEARNGDQTEMRSLIIPASQAVFRGLVELLWEQLKEGA